MLRAGLRVAARTALSSGTPISCTARFMQSNRQVALPAIVPGTVLNSLVYDGVYPEPYYGLNNKLESELIPDLYRVGRDFYTYWFRTEFRLDKKAYGGRKIWLQADGINYRSEIWLNGNMVGKLLGGINSEKQMKALQTMIDEVLARDAAMLDKDMLVKPDGK